MTWFFCFPKRLAVGARFKRENTWYDLNKFTDVGEKDWYYEEMQKSVVMETFEGSGDNSIKIIGDSKINKIVNTKGWVERFKRVRALLHI